MVMPPERRRWGPRYDPTHEELGELIEERFDELQKKLEDIERKIR